MRRLLVAARAARLAGLAGLLAGSYAGCVGKVRLSVHDAADIALPPEVRRLAVAPAATPEAEAAADGLRARLLGSDRVALVDEAAADAIVTIRSRGGRSVLEDQPEDGGWIAVRTAKVGLDLELRSRSGELIDHLDDVVVIDQWIGRSETAAEAEAAVATSEEAERALYWSAGAAYARRIAPMQEDVVRPLEIRGHPALRRAHREVLAGDWDRAIRTWLGIDEAQPPSARARAAYDLAVAYEVRGEYRRALEQLERALAMDAWPRPGSPTRSRWLQYRRALTESISEHRLLRQVEPTPSEAP